MVDFGFYTGVFAGSRIPEPAFEEFATRAVEALQRLRRYYTVTGAAEAEKLAICAIADEIYASTGRRGGVSAASVGALRVSYKDRDRGIYDCAAIYLDIYRGVGQ